MRSFVIALMVSVFSISFAYAFAVEGKSVVALDRQEFLEMYGQVQHVELAARLGKKIEPRQIFLRTKAKSLASGWKTPYETSYPNGDVYYLAGDINSVMTQNEFTRYYQIAKWLANEGFRPILNPTAYVSDVREAVTNANTAVIIWSSHGSADGAVYDSANAALPDDIFDTEAGPRFKELVLSSCFGGQSALRYRLNAQTRMIHWTDLTNSADLFAYLMSTQWDLDLAKDLGVSWLTTAKQKN